MLAGRRCQPDPITSVEGLTYQYSGPKAALGVYGTGLGRSSDRSGLLRAGFGGSGLFRAVFGDELFVLSLHDLVLGI